MKIPSALVESLETVAGFNKEAFEKVHNSGEQITSIRINPLKTTPNSNPQTVNPIPWSENGYYLTERPSFTFDPLFHAGCYYVQEASSMFLEQALKQTLDLSKQLRVLDLCASPGGKSTHIQSLISADSILVSNEVIRGRIPALQDNIIKWGCENVIVTNNDPAHFSSLENFFDVMIIDAPCSGSGLFRRDPEAIEEWSEQNVQLCSARQQRILRDAWPALKNDGILIYSTCSYSPEEDEQIVDEILKIFNAAYVPLSTDNDWGIVNTGKGYRFWPDKVKGEGFFIAVFRKKEGDTKREVSAKSQPISLTNKESSFLESWMKTEGKKFIKRQERIFAIPENVAEEINYLQNSLKVVYPCLRVGELIRDKLIPDHALAMSNIVSAKSRELDYDDAIRYLQRKEINIDAAKGWQLVTCQNHPLGWINALPNRINNYYPKELRILKDRQ